MISDQFQPDRTVVAEEGRIKHLMSCDVLVDDSVRNCLQAMKVGFPAILITRPHNIHVDYPYRVNRLDIDEILEVYSRIV